MANKKFYWLKLKEDFFRDKRIKKLRKIAGGDTYTVIYLKLQLLSLKNNGVLIYEGIEENFVEEMALEIDEDVDNVKITLAFLQSNGLLDEIEQDHYVMTETIKCIGSESASAERVRKHRELKEQKKKLLQCNAQVTTSNIEIEKEKEIDLEVEIEEELEVEIKKEVKPLTPNGEVVTPKKNNKSKVDTTVLTIEEQAFNEFWQAYPKKVNKKGCFAAFKKIKDIQTELPLILDALERFKTSNAWLKDKGQYIPYPTTFINQERWKDEQEVTREEQLNNIDMEGWI